MVSSELTLLTCRPARAERILLDEPVSSPKSMNFESFTLVGTSMLWPKRNTFVQFAISGEM